jgi:hypothetical protein
MIINRSKYYGNSIWCIEAYAHATGKNISKLKKKIE